MVEMPDLSSILPLNDQNIISRVFMELASGIVATSYSFCPPCHHSGTLCPCCLLYSNLWWLFLLPLLALALPQTMESCQEVYWVRFCPWLTFVLSFSSLKILLLDNFQIYAAESDFFPQPERSVSNCL